MRADARRNHARLLDAVVEEILERGTEPPLDAIARRAGVGIGTLYRRFPDREALLNAVALHVLDRSRTAAEAALADASTGHDAIRRYMHAAIDAGDGVLNLVRPLLGTPDWSAQRRESARLLGELVARGTSDQSARADVHVTDIVFAVIRFSRPVAVGLPRADERAIAHRHLDIYIDGLASHPTRRPLVHAPALQRLGRT
jgi:AcrR family transcriptional regulator